MSVVVAIKSLAVKRLKQSLSIWNNDKDSMNYSWLYICARHKGTKLDSIWIKNTENYNERIQNEFKSVMGIATSFEVEMLHSPEERILKITGSNQCNSLRGRRAMFIELNKNVMRWSATEIIANNTSFNSALKKYLLKLGLDTSTFESATVTLYKTKQLFCDNRPSSSLEIKPVDMFRGNTVVEVDEVTQQSVFRMIETMSRWLATQVSDNGAASYKYWPSRGTYSKSNNAIRQWMATICLNRIAKAFDNNYLEGVAHRNFKFNLKSMFRKQQNIGFIWMDGSAKLGATALAALAILESSDRSLYSDEESSLCALIKELSNPDGSFDTFLIPRERKDNQNFYSGEALLYLASRYAISRDPKDLERIMDAFYYYREWHRSNQNPAFIPWHTQAYYLVWKVTANEELKEFIFEMNDWLLGFQQWNSAEFFDMQGRFYDPKRAHMGPPHASSTGVYLEGLIDAYSVAILSKDDIRAVQYRGSILRGVRSIMQLQFKGEDDCFYIKHVNRVLGGVRTTVYDNTIRIDNVQHALMAMLKIFSRFSDSDYSLDYPLNISNVKSDMSPKYFPLVWCDDEIRKTCLITQVYKKRSWFASSVIARDSRMASNSLYFAKQDASKELALICNSSSKPSAVIAEPGTAEALSKELSIPVYEVKSQLETARSLADIARSRSSAKVIGITGSVGKTSVKDALTQILSAQGETHATEGNANDGWGVLNTLMNLPTNACYAVMELGMLGVGSVKIKSERIKPHVGIITNIHDAHLAYHNDESSIALTKSGVLDGIVPDGVAVLPRDSTWYGLLKHKAEELGIQKIITFGQHIESDFQLLNISVESGKNLVHAKILGKFVKFEIGASGPHWAMNSMIILSAVHAVGHSIQDAMKIMPTIQPSFRRGEIYRVESDSINYTIIDDTWNASPASVSAAINNLAAFDMKGSGRRVLFIGDMLQLGQDEVKKHTGLVDVIVSNGIDKVFAVGELTKSLFDELPISLRGKHFSNAAIASKYAKRFIENNDVILVKGSNAMEMWRVVRELSYKKSALVGTQPEWRVEKI